MTEVDLTECQVIRQRINENLIAIQGQLRQSVTNKLNKLKRDIEIYKQRTLLRELREEVGGLFLSKSNIEDNEIAGQS